MSCVVSSNPVIHIVGRTIEIPAKDNIQFSVEGEAYRNLETSLVQGISSLPPSGGSGMFQMVAILCNMQTVRAMFIE